MNTLNRSTGRRLRLVAHAVRFGTNYLAGTYGGDRLLPQAPAALLVGVTSKCNLRCDFCFHADNDIPTEARRPKGMMPFERFAAIVDQAHGWCTHLEFALFGEPMLHPRFIDMVRLAVEADLTVGIFSNATLLNATRARDLVAAGPASVTVSMEGGTPEEYNRVRVGARWENVAANLRGLVAARREAGRRAPFIIVRGIELEGQAGQRQAHAALYHEMGVDQVMWVPATNWSGSLRAPQESVRVPPPPPHTQPCRFPRLQLGIDWDGTVVPCCVDFNAKNNLGNVDVTPLREIWAGKTLTALRAALATRDHGHIAATTGCAGCSHLAQPALPPDKRLQAVRMALGQFQARLADG